MQRSWSFCTPVAPLALVFVAFALSSCTGEASDARPAPPRDAAIADATPPRDAATPVPKDAVELDVSWLPRDEDGAPDVLPGPPDTRPATPGDTGPGGSQPGDALPDTGPSGPRGRLVGQVAGFGWAPEEGVLVTVAGRTVRTGADGTFSFDDLPAGRAIVRTEKRGFTTVVRPVDIPAGGTATVEPRVFDPHGVGGEGPEPYAYYATRGRTRVAIEVGTLELGGEWPSGMWLQDIELASTEVYAAPAPLRGADLTGKETTLVGVAAVEVSVETESGASAQLVDGAAAELTIQLPPDVDYQSGDRIGAWLLDPSTGLWHERGALTVEAYGLDKHRAVGELDALGIWALGGPTPTRRLCVRATVKGDSPAVGAEVVGTTRTERGFSYDAATADGAGVACLHLAPGDGEVLVHTRSSGGLQGSAKRVSLPAEGDAAAELAVELPAPPPESPDCDEDPLRACRACVSGRSTNEGISSCSNRVEVLGEYPEGRRRRAMVRDYKYLLPVPAGSRVEVSGDCLGAGSLPMNPVVETTNPQGGCALDVDFAFPTGVSAAACRERYGSLTVESVEVTGTELEVDFAGLEHTFVTALGGSLSSGPSLVFIATPDDVITAIPPLEGPFFYLSISGGFYWTRGSDGVLEWNPSAAGVDWTRWGVLAARPNENGVLRTWTAGGRSVVRVDRYVPGDADSGEPGLVTGTFDLEMVPHCSAPKPSRVWLRGSFRAPMLARDELAANACRAVLRRAIKGRDRGRVRVWLDGEEVPPWASEGGHGGCSMGGEDGVMYCSAAWSSAGSASLGATKGMYQDELGHLAFAGIQNEGEYSGRHSCWCTKFAFSGQVDFVPDGPLPPLDELMRMAARFKGPLTEVFSTCAPCGPETFELWFEGPVCHGGTVAL